MTRHAACTMGLMDQRRRRRMRDDIKRFRARQENADAKTTAQVKEVTEKGFALGDRLRGEQARSGGCLEGRSSSHL